MGIRCVSVECRCCVVVLVVCLLILVMVEKGGFIRMMFGCSFMFR